MTFEKQLRWNKSQTIQQLLMKHGEIHYLKRKLLFTNKEHFNTCPRFSKIKYDVEEVIISEILLLSKCRPSLERDVMLCALFLYLGSVKAGNKFRQQIMESINKINFAATNRSLKS